VQVAIAARGELWRCPMAQFSAGLNVALRWSASVLKRVVQLYLLLRFARSHPGHGRFAQPVAAAATTRALVVFIRMVVVDTVQVL
jgi:hypothetical protein